MEKSSQPARRKIEPRLFKLWKHPFNIRCQPEVAIRNKKMAAPAVIQEEIREVLDTETGLVNRVRTTRVGIPDGEGGLVVAEATSAVTARVMGTERDEESPERETERSKFSFFNASLQM